MDEAVGDDETAMRATDSVHLRRKESEFALKPDISNMLESHEMATTFEDHYHESTNNLSVEILDAKHADRIGSSGHASASPRCMDEAGVIVEELTLENYDGENLAVVGTSNNRERMQTRQNHWQQLCQLPGGSGSSGLRRKGGHRDRKQAALSVWEDEGNTFFRGLLDQNQQSTNYNTGKMGCLLRNDERGASSDMLYTHGGIRTKIVSKSGFSEYFIKSSLGGKGVICKGPAQRRSDSKLGDQACSESTKAGLVESTAALGRSADNIMPPSPGITESQSSLNSYAYQDGPSLRRWLKRGRNSANRRERLQIFRQILDLVDFAHSQGVVLKDLRPSCFKLLASDQVVYFGASVSAEVAENVTYQDVPQLVHDHKEKRPMSPDVLPLASLSVKKQKLGETVNFARWPQFSTRSGVRSASENVPDAIIRSHGNESDETHNPRMEIMNQRKYSSSYVSNTSPPLMYYASSMPEEKWYTSPEHFNESGCTFSSNIYCLGVLLFELLGSFDSERSHDVAMLDLRHRILPPQFLSENPKEAGFCLWLLHPQPSSRPTTRDILQSELVRGIQHSSGGELVLPSHEEDCESELLLYFLESLSEQKQKDASKLMEQIQWMESDIQEVEKRQLKKSLAIPSSPQDSQTAKASKFALAGESNLGGPLEKFPVDSDAGFMRNIRQLESAYFSMRSNIHRSDSVAVTRRDGILRSRERRYNMDRDEENSEQPMDSMGSFFDGLCKYARYSKFKVRGVLGNGDFSNSANVICSLSFDRDEDYLATGGVSKKIKIFEYEALFSDSINIHYPLIEMTNKSKLSCICWNGYIRNYLASTDYDGVVKLWDAASGQEFLQFAEHGERAWSVDFSHLEPTKLASGSDDRMVKLWSINERNSLCTIRNNANVCSVQFSTDSSHLLAFSSADYKIYCYDLRNVSTPWCILAGHEKTVSYAKFLDAQTLVSASTDNTLKIWDLEKTSSNSFSRDACILTLKGHTNEKNFVGLSVADGYIACGSETNEVFAYYKTLPMPITSHKFGSIDPISGKETEDDNGHFVSSVCWRRKSNMVVAANSTGCLKLLQLV